ncbi:hypothetical protein [Aquimarina celericrescens]|uniref:DUF5648 domain-containing protein n=1 Tax=Aquimarina celericrescens TaxID=1964542 RepID=A0ABW5B1Y2_9FLAO|nr:hypothetical protein [Aquimarina celericrescens]
MKKRFIFALAITTMFYSCDKDDGIEQTTESIATEKGYQLDDGTFIGAGYGFTSGESRLYATPFEHKGGNQAIVKSNLPSDLKAVSGSYAYVEDTYNLYKLKGNADSLGLNFKYRDYIDFNFYYQPGLTKVSTEDKNKVSVIVKIDVVTSKYDVLGKPGYESLTSTAKNLAKNDTDRFREKYGDLYVESAIYGASLNFVFNFDSTLLTEYERKTLKAGFGLGILKVFGIGFGTDKQKVESERLLSKVQTVDFDTNSSGFTPDKSITSDPQTYIDELKRFTNHVKTDPLNSVVLAQKTSNYSKYITQGGFNDDPTLAKKCIKLKNEWDYVYKVMDVIVDNAGDTGTRNLAKQLRSEAASNKESALKCNTYNLPSSIAVLRKYEDFVRFYEIKLRDETMRRFYDNVGKTYFYTYDQNEINSLGQQSSRYRDEGNAFYVLNSRIGNDTDIVPLYRFVSYNGSKVTYFYTTNKSEGDNYFQKYEGIAGYVYKKSKDGTVALYRYRNKDTYLYTTDKGEGNNAVKNFGFKYEGVQCYVFKL